MKIGAARTGEEDIQGNTGDQGVEVGVEAEVEIVIEVVIP